jgi:hypothetical protein
MGKIMGGRKDGREGDIERLLFAKRVRLSTEGRRIV